MPVTSTPASVDVLAAPQHDANAVSLVGRLSSVDPVRDLPSGDQLLAFRLVVRRPARVRARGATVDVIDCHVATAKLRRAVGALELGARLEVDGSLRRRFFRAGGAMGSRYAVEVSALRRASR